MSKIETPSGVTTVTPNDEIGMLNTCIEITCPECGYEGYFHVFEAIDNDSMFNPCEDCGTAIGFSKLNRDIDKIKHILNHFNIKFPATIQVFKPKTERQIWNYHVAKKQTFMRDHNCVHCDKFSNCNLIYAGFYDLCSKPVIKPVCPYLKACKLAINGFADLCKKRSTISCGV